MNFIYLNGKFIKKEKAYVSVLDHGFLYGDGIFETMRSYNGTVYLINEHIDRLFESAKAVFLNMPLSKKEIKNAIYNTLKKNNLKDAYIRLTISRGYGEPGLDINICKNPTIVIYTKQFISYPEEWHKNGIKIICITGSNEIGHIKSCNYLNNILAKIKAYKRGAQEAIFINNRGYVTEGVISNIFIVNSGVLTTPSLNNNILPGITRREVMNISKKEGIEVKEMNIKQEDIISSDECFLTNTGFEIIPVKELYEKKRWEMCPGDITMLLTDRFKERINRVSHT